MGVARAEDDVYQHVDGVASERSYDDVNPVVRVMARSWHKLLRRDEQVFQRGQRHLHMPRTETRQRRQSHVLGR